MSRNGSGIYNLPTGNPVVTGTTITSTWANNTLSDIASALTGSIASDGQTPMIGDLSMATNKITNLGTPSLSTDATTKDYVDTAVAGATSTALQKASNLSDLPSASTARTNLGLGSIATQNSSSVSVSGTINSVSPGSNSVGNRTVSSSTPSGGSNGDIWYKY